MVASSAAQAPRRGSTWRVAYSPDLGFVPTDPAVSRLVRNRLAEVAATGYLEVVDPELTLADPSPAWLTIREQESGLDVDSAALRTASDIVDHNNAILDSLFNSVDALVTPTTPRTAHGYDEHETNLVAGDLCWAFSLSGHPAISVPAGLLDGMPVGLQVVAARQADHTAAQIARLCQVELRNYIGTQHILLALIREGQGVAARVLVRQGADLNRVRQQVLQLLANPGANALVAQGGGPRETDRLRAEVDRLRRLLHRHDIDPDEANGDAGRSP